MIEWDNWNPGYWKLAGLGEIFIPYEKKWYCNTNKLIHSSKKEVLNCKYCNKSLDIKK
jgi:hypothetical protein